jgi:predicted metal-dependent hydrolase
MAQTRRARSTGPEELEVKGLHTPIEVRRHPAARRMTLRVSRTRHAVIMTVPMRCNLAEAGSFVTNHIDWVRQHLGSVPSPVPFADGETIPLRGTPHVLRFTGTRDDRFLVRVTPDANGGVPSIVVSGPPQHASRLLANWLIENARRDLDQRVLFHAKKLGVRPKRIALRDPSSRWGSCSTTRVLSFSWRLVLAPPYVLDYVAAHEVAHLAEMNHGSRFWSLVASTVDRMEEARQWLRIRGMDLHRYGQQ